jgi:hypothetical protein
MTHPPFHSPSQGESHYVLAHSSLLSARRGAQAKAQGMPAARHHFVFAETLCGSRSATKTSYVSTGQIKNPACRTAEEISS